MLGGVDGAAYAVCMKIILALPAFLSIAGALPAYADQNDPRLDALFTELRAETDLGKAQTVMDEQVARAGKKDSLDSH